MVYFSEDILGGAVAPRNSSYLWLDAHPKWHEGDGMGVAVWVRRWVTGSSCPYMWPQWGPSVRGSHGYKNELVDQQRLRVRQRRQKNFEDLVTNAVNHKLRCWELSSHLLSHLRSHREQPAVSPLSFCKDSVASGPCPTARRREPTSECLRTYLQPSRQNLSYLKKLQVIG